MDLQQQNFWLSLRNTLAFFSEELWCRKKTLALFALATICANLIQFISPYYTQKLIDIAIPAKDATLIGRYTIYIALSIVLSYLVSLVYVRYTVKICTSIQAAMREKLVGRLLSKEPSFFSHFSSGDILTRLSTDLDGIGDFFYGTFLYTFFIYTTAVIAYLAWLFYMNWFLAIISVVFFAVSMSLSLIYYRSISSRAMKAQRHYSEVNDIALDMIGGEKEIRLYQQKNRFINRFRTENQAYANAHASSVLLKDTVWISFVHLMKLNTSAPLLIGAFMIYLNVGHITVGLLVAFAQVLMSTTDYVRSISYALIDNSSISASIDRVNEVMTSHAQTVEPPVQIEQTPVSDAVEFRNVAFSYPSGKKIFRNLNLRIEGGERVAIMAPSGFGKTTLANLLLRMQEPDSGTILFGERDIRLYPKNFYLSYFAYVGPQTHIFKLSVRENIEMGWAATDEAHLMKILETLRLGEVVRHLPQSADTVLQRQGMTLSEGQKQRIALGRALIREPQVMVLDEFSAALDRQTEEQILDDLLALVDKQTIICITHSQYVASRMGRIISLPDVAG